MDGLPSELLDPRKLYDQVGRQPTPASITALLKSVVARHPDQDALRFIDGSPSLTYAELDEAVANVAGGLKARGVKFGTRIAVVLPNKPAFPITYLAAARLGAVIVPLNTALTQRELTYALNDSGATSAVVDCTLADPFKDAVADLPNGWTDTVIVGAPASDPASFDRLLGASAFKGDDGRHDALMSIQYTSGTTGWPKGALQTQEFWMCIGMAQSAELTYLGIKNILVVHSFFYMDAFWELMMSFCMAGTIVLAPRMSGSNYMAWIRDYDIHYALVTSHIYKQPESRLDTVHNLKLLQTYGFAKEIHADFERRFAVPVRETFGMTEIGAGAFVPVVAADKVGSGAVGIAAPFRTLKIVDETGAEVPIGAIGELLVTGRGLFLGYNNRPEATAEVLTDGWVRTGDLFRRDADGFYYIVGRKKDMVRRNSENIAAREVEDILLAHPDVVNAAIFAVPDQKKTEEVLALVVLREGHTPESVTPQALYEYCQQRLARFKWPRYFGYRTSFPLTPSAKVAKHEIRKASANLLDNVFDTEESVWISAEARSR